MILPFSYKEHNSIINILAEEKGKLKYLLGIELNESQKLIKYYTKGKIGGEIDLAFFGEKEYEKFLVIIEVKSSHYFGTLRDLLNQLYKRYKDKEIIIENLNFYPSDVYYIGALFNGSIILLNTTKLINKIGECSKLFDEKWLIEVFSGTINRMIKNINPGKNFKKDTLEFNIACGHSLQGNTRSHLEHGS